MWPDQAVVYQIYPRSFQDSNGDGVGDLSGIRSRLDHLVGLGVDALWLSPIYPSPLADLGYDVCDYTDVDRVYGTLGDFDALLAVAHERGLRVLLDMVPCHTSIEHPWFREHPDWYIWADGRDGGPPNNWSSTFGGSAWSFDEERGRWYLHSFYPEQPDLDWRNPEVVDAMHGVLRFWLGRGVDGYRVDAIDRLLKDPELRDDPPATEPFGLPLRADEVKLALSNSRNHPDIGEVARVGQRELHLVRAQRKPEGLGRRGIVAKLGILQQAVDGVDPVAVDPPPEPEAQHAVHGLDDLGVAPVEVRLLGVERVQVPPPTLLVEAPGRAAEGARPVVRGPPVPAVGPDVPVGVLAEPRVLDRRVARDHVEEDSEPALVGHGQQRVEVPQGPVHAVYVGVVADVVAQVGER